MSVNSSGPMRGAQADYQASRTCCRHVEAAVTAPTLCVAAGVENTDRMAPAPDGVNWTASMDVTLRKVA